MQFVATTKAVSMNGMTVGELEQFIKDLRLAGARDGDVPRVQTKISWSADGAPMKSMTLRVDSERIV